MLSKGEPVAATTRVENDVTVYEHAPDALDKAPQWTLESAPASTIGGAGGDPQYDLTRAYFVVPLSDGRVMTFAPVGNKVFVFGRDGKGERVIGKTGQGPGDWMHFGTPVLLEDDTVLVLDLANNRLNWVTADGGIVRTAPYPVTGDMRFMNHIPGFMSTGELLMHSAGSWGGHQTDSLQRSLARVMAANIRTGETRSLGPVPDLPGAQVETRYRGRVRKDWKPLRLGGSALIEAWDSVYASVIASSRSIELRDATGVLRVRIDVPATRRSVTSAMRDAQIALELEAMKAQATERMVDPRESERLAREAPFADSLPYFAHMMMGSDETLWVVDAIAPNDSGWTATAFWKDGGILARLTVSVRSIPMAFGAGQVIVRTQDENDVVSFQVYRLVSAEKRLDTDKPK
jgi:6-bladed beta-propeller